MPAAVKFNVFEFFKEELNTEDPLLRLEAVCKCKYVAYAMSANDGREAIEGSPS